MGSLNIYNFGLCAGIFKQFMGARKRVGIGLSYRPARLHGLGGIDFLESIPGLLPCLKIPSLVDCETEERAREAVSMGVGLLYMDLFNVVQYSSKGGICSFYSMKGEA